jgi:hypothetical protein
VVVVVVAYVWARAVCVAGVLMDVMPDYHSGVWLLAVAWRLACAVALPYKPKRF